MYLLKEWCEREYGCVYVIIDLRPLLICLSTASHLTPFRPLWCSGQCTGGRSGNYCPHFTAEESEVYAFPTSLSPKPARLTTLPTTYITHTHTYKAPVRDLQCLLGLRSSTTLEVSSKGIRIDAAFPNKFAFFSFLFAYYRVFQIYLFIFTYDSECINRLYENYCKGAKASPNYQFLDLPLSQLTRKHLRLPEGHPRNSCALRPQLKGGSTDVKAALNSQAPGP